ncbi:E3 ubiquitin-protein ligase RHF2A-like isoform X3 [Phoenix dactylifera]|uniref:RING-type E3 ubiquitin transferase n=1 Tax=Phoenix dactylifera TaxID=42345 RepID=A0A8B8ZKW8_PHODC|nr:E3 ubiquitin-protein ligase RHF2A-like isoform X3 [Phoenix dactylifera]
MEDTAKMESHLSSAAAFVEGGIQDACDDACSICLEAFCDSDPSAATGCKHEFHLQCILEWCQRSSQCPMCWQSISLKDPTSQELLEAVEQERGIRVNRSRHATIFHHPMLGDFELQHLPVGADDAELEERIIQHLNAAAAMGPSSGPSIGSVSASSAHRWENEPAPAITAAIPSIPLAATEVESIHQDEVSTGQADQVTTLPSGNSVAAANSPRIFAGQSMPVSQDRAGPSDFHSFSESLKSRLSAVSMRYKESITKSTRGWKERLFTRSTSIADLGSEVRREVNAGIATVSRMIERLETRENVGASGTSASNSAQTHSVTETSDGRAIGSHINSLPNDTNISASCAANSDEEGGTLLLEYPNFEKHGGIVSGHILL